MCVKHVQHIHCGAAVDAVINLFTVTTRGHQGFFAEHSELLRECWLLNVQQFLELTHAAFALRQLAKQQQPIRVSHHAHQRAGTARSRAHGR